jgi:hypothetical protein
MRRIVAAGAARVNFGPKLLAGPDDLNWPNRKRAIPRVQPDGLFS